ncbi:MAG: MFS transporter [Fimbriimonadaceae bacterium]|nr:MFS transporter [Fimbriimonadaceae bacterium]
MAEQPLPLSREKRIAMWSALLVAWLGWMFDGLEMGLYSWAVPPALKQFLGTTDSKAIGPYLSYTVALFLVGMSFGGVVFGRLGDKIGRVKTMIVTVVVYALFTGLSGFCHSVWQLGACRFLGAMGLGGEWGLGVALVMETWPNTSRPLLAGLLGGAANVGFLVAAWLTKWLSHHEMVGRFENWRIALMLGFLPAILTLVVRLFVKESEKFVHVQEKGRRTRFLDLFSPELRRNSIVGIAVSAVAVLGMWGVYQAWMQGWVQTMVESLPGSTKEMVGAARAQVGEYMAYGSIIGAVLGGLLAQWTNRRTSYAIFCVGALLASGLLYGTCTEFGPRLLWLAMLGGVFAASFFGWLPLYLPELFPTHIRASGEGLTFNAGRIISAAGVLVTGQLSNALGGPQWASLAMSSVWLVGLVLIWFVPETKGQELPD